jgi:hypothetical protein
VPALTRLVEFFVTGRVYQAKDLSVLRWLGLRMTPLLVIQQLVLALSPVLLTWEMTVML